MAVRAMSHQRRHHNRALPRAAASLSQAHSDSRAENHLIEGIILKMSGFCNNSHHSLAWQAP
jgi:hypothetical protein